MNKAHHDEPLRKPMRLKMLLLMSVITKLVLASIKPPPGLKSLSHGCTLPSTTRKSYWVELVLRFYTTLHFKTDTKTKHKRNTYTTGKTLGKTTLASAKYS